MKHSEEALGTTPRTNSHHDSLPQPGAWAGRGDVSPAARAWGDSEDEQRPALPVRAPVGSVLCYGKDYLDWKQP